MSISDDYMTLGPGYGIVPKEQRNAGYKKLGIQPGEGGLALAGTKPEASMDATLDAFLAGVAAGADPKQLASELRSKPTSRRRAA